MYWKFALAVLVILFVIWYMRTPTPAPVVAQPVPTPTSAQAPWCSGGVYCNGQPVLQADAGVGASVCGTDQVQYQCATNNGTTAWTRLGTACTATQMASCPQAAATSTSAPTPAIAATSAS